MCVLNKIMLRENITGKQLSNFSGVSESTISAIKNGRGNIKTLERLLRSMGYELTCKEMQK